MQKDGFWNSNGKMSNEIPSIIFMEAYREDVYKHSEYFNQNA